MVGLLKRYPLSMNSNMFLVAVWAGWWAYVNACRNMIATIFKVGNLRIVIKAAPVKLQKDVHCVKQDSVENYDSAAKKKQLSQSKQDGDNWHLQ